MLPKLKSLNNLHRKAKKIKRSYIELAVKELLDYMNVDYVEEAVIGIEHLGIGNRKAVNPDFLVGNTAIEVNGSYVHGDPKKYEELNKMQMKTHEKDVQKKEAYRKLGYDYMIIWESDIKEDYMNVYKMMKHCLTK